MDRLYHVTDRSDVEDILRNGFLPGWGDFGLGIYLFGDLSSARRFAKKGGWDRRLKSPVILEVRTGEAVQEEPHPEWPNPEAYKSIWYVPREDDGEDIYWKPSKVTEVETVTLGSARKKHRGAHIREVARLYGTSTFNELLADGSIDVAICVRDRVLAAVGIDDAGKGWVEPDEVLEVLEILNPTFPILGINPKLLDACNQRSFQKGKVEAYEDIWKSGGEDFPPVTIDTSQDEWVLCEGGHRSCSAAKAGVSEIHAIDVSELDLKPVIAELAAMYPGLAETFERLQPPGP